MNIFMIGNGLDLHFDLPTSYICFLNVMERICSLDGAGERISSVFQVLNDPVLQNVETIKRCCNRYGKSYDTKLDPAQMQIIAQKAAGNLWLRFLMTSFRSNGGWVDFEHEVGRVLDAFRVLFDSITVSKDTAYVLFSRHHDIEYSWRICSMFPFFYQSSLTRNTSDGIDFFDGCILKQFICENPPESAEYDLDKEAIANELFLSLRELADLLASYLYLFVDMPVCRIVQSNPKFYDAFFATTDWSFSRVISFNYTHTLSYLEKYVGHDLGRRVAYLHGELMKDKIVLGVNSDDKDELDKLELTFVSFKKYFQRTCYRTDLGYMRLLNLLKSGEHEKDKYTLFVIGHSLDVTDGEVIRECFRNAGRIFVFSHNQKDMEKHIRNLVSLFGKEEFDHLRLSKGLTFAPIDDLRLEANAFISKYALG